MPSFKNYTLISKRNFSSDEVDENAGRRVAGTAGIIGAGAGAGYLSDRVIKKVVPRMNEKSSGQTVELFINGRKGNSDKILGAWMGSTGDMLNENAGYLLKNLKDPGVEHAIDMALQNPNQKQEAINSLMDAAAGKNTWATSRNNEITAAVGRHISYTHDYSTVLDDYKSVIDLMNKSSCTPDELNTATERFLENIDGLNPSNKDRFIKQMSERIKTINNKQSGETLDSVIELLKHTDANTKNHTVITALNDALRDPEVAKAFEQKIGQLSAADKTAILSHLPQSRAARNAAAARVEQQLNDLSNAQDALRQIRSKDLTTEINKTKNKNQALIREYQQSLDQMNRGEWQDAINTLNSYANNNSSVNLPKEVADLNRAMSNKIEPYEKLLGNHKYLDPSTFSDIQQGLAEAESDLLNKVDNDIKLDYKYDRIKNKHAIEKTADGKGFTSLGRVSDTVNDTATVAMHDNILTAIENDTVYLDKTNGALSFKPGQSIPGTKIENGKLKITDVKEFLDSDFYTKTASNRIHANELNKALADINQLGELKAGFLRRILLKVDQKVLKLLLKINTVIKSTWLTNFLQSPRRLAIMQAANFKLWGASGDAGDVFIGGSPKTKQLTSEMTSKHHTTGKRVVSGLLTAVVTTGAVVGYQKYKRSITSQMNTICNEKNRMVYNFSDVKNLFVKADSPFNEIYLSMMDSYKKALEKYLSGASDGSVTYNSATLEKDLTPWRVGLLFLFGEKATGDTYILMRVKFYVEGDVELTGNDDSSNEKVEKEISCFDEIYDAFSIESTAKPDIWWDFIRSVKNGNWNNKNTTNLGMLKPKSISSNSGDYLTDHVKPLINWKTGKIEEDLYNYAESPIKNPLYKSGFKNIYVGRQNNRPIPRGTATTNGPDYLLTSTGLFPSSAEHGDL